MKAKLQKKKLTSMVNEVFLLNTQFICLISEINQNLINNQTIISNKVPKIILKNSKKLSNIFPNGLQKQIALKSFDIEKEFSSFLYEKKPNNICLAFVKYKNYFLDVSQINFNKWSISIENSQKRILKTSKSPTLPILISNISKDFANSKNFK